MLLEYTQQRYPTHDEYPFDPLPAQSGDELNHESLVKWIIARTVMFEFISKLEKLETVGVEAAGHFKPLGVPACL
jgi:hypothetical protein